MTTKLSHKRKPRDVSCSGCAVNIHQPQARIDTTARAFCKDCTASPRYEKYRNAAHTYGLLFDELEILYNTPECECCGQELDQFGDSRTGVNIDHCHTTGKVRGALCWSCNVGIGHLNDNLAGVENAYNYLRRLTCEE